MRITATTTSNLLGLPEVEDSKAKYIQDVEAWGNKNGQEGTWAVSQISDFIKEPKRTNLSFCWCRLTNVPPLGFIAERIQVLNLCNSQVQKLPESLGKLRNLERLYLSGNQLKELPESIKFPKLEVLWVSGNRDLKSIPPSLLDFPFRELNSEGTQITKPLAQLKQERQEDRAKIAFHLLLGKIEPRIRLPESSVLRLNQFIKEPSRYLEDLYAWRKEGVKEGVEEENRAEAVSRIQSFINHPAETDLCFLNLRLTTVPPLGFIAERIKDLDLEGNQLQELPESLRELRSLRILDLDDNRLQNIPEALGELQNLEALLVRGNPDLRGIPSSLVDLPKFETLCSERTKIPKTLEELREDRVKEKGRLF